MDTLYMIACISVVAGILCFFIILVDILNGHQQHMMVMNFVWPITALYSGPLALIAYYTIGRKGTHGAMKMEGENDDMHSQMPMQMKDGSGGITKRKMPQKPFWQSVVNGALHCGSGCTLGDIVAEAFLFFIPVTLFGSTLYGGWFIDFVLAFLLGIVFQYYAIKPMKHLSRKQALIAAFKADTLSLTAWQVGMYGGMAIAMFLIFKQRLQPSGIVFWMVMQLAMMLGFVTAYSVNWWLIRSGIKEKM